MAVGTYAAYGGIHVSGCPNVGGICIGCTMPGFPDKFMPFMDEPPGAKISSAVIGIYGAAIRAMRNLTNATVSSLSTAGSVDLTPM